MDGWMQMMDTDDGWIDADDGYTMHVPCHASPYLPVQYVHTAICSHSSSNSSAS